MDILEYYRPTSVKEVDACILSGSHIYLVSQEGTGKTKL